jgi:hypothetical protein
LSLRYALKVFMAVFLQVTAAHAAQEHLTVSPRLLNVFNGHFARSLPECAVYNDIGLETEKIE